MSTTMPMNLNLTEKPRKTINVLRNIALTILIIAALSLMERLQASTEVTQADAKQSVSEQLVSGAIKCGQKGQLDGC